MAAAPSGQLSAASQVRELSDRATYRHCVARCFRHHTHGRRRRKQRAECHAASMDAGQRHPNTDYLLTGDSLIDVSRDWSAHCENCDRGSSPLSSKLNGRIFPRAAVSLCAEQGYENRLFGCVKIRALCEAVPLRFLLRFSTVQDSVTWIAWS